MWPLKSFIEREGSGGDRGLDARRRSMKRWRQWAKAMSIRWRGDFHGRRMLKKGQCNEQRGPKATLPELAKHEESPDRPQTDLEYPTQAWRVFRTSRRWSRCEGEATMIQGDSQQAHAPSCPIHHVEKRSRHREGHHDGQDPKNEGQRSRRRSRSNILALGGPQLGPRGPYQKACLWG